jgi:hypothetical protein
MPPMMDAMSMTISVTAREITPARVSVDVLILR